MFKFIEKIEDHEPDGPVSVTLITLKDGRVVGINDECIVLYPSRAAFDDAENVDNQIIDLAAREQGDCPECARSYGPHYSGPCEHV